MDALARWRSSPRWKEKRQIPQFAPVRACTAILTVWCGGHPESGVRPSRLAGVAHARTAGHPGWPDCGVIRCWLLVAGITLARRAAAFYRGGQMGRAYARAE